MSKRTIEIERLEIRLNGITPESARAAAGGLGRELLDQLAGLQSKGDGRTGIFADAFGAAQDDRGKCCRIHHTTYQVIARTSRCHF